MKIYTRTGDRGQTSLFGNERVSKSDLRICAYGTIDELNAILGLARAESLPQCCEEVAARLQHQLFEVGAELATPKPEENGTASIHAEDIAYQEAKIDDFETELEPLKSFILPGGTKAASTIHLARCVCRRAEREIVALAAQESIRELIVEFVNRTSDLLFVMARRINALSGAPDVPWVKPS